MSGTVEILAKAPNKLLLNMSLLNGQFVRKQGYDGQNGWELDPESGLKRLAGAELQQTKLDAVFDADIRFAELYPDMKVVGKTSVGSREAYKVSTKGPDGKNKNFYFDAQTWLRIAEDAETTGDDGKNLELKSFFEDYRAVAGVQLPFRVRITSSSISFVMNFQEVKHNVPIEDSSFAVPVESAAASKPAGATAADTPDEGETKGHIYVNKFFGMQYDFPEDWTIHGEETKKRIMEVGKNAVSGDDPSRKAGMESAVKHTQILLSLFKYPLGTPNVLNQSIQVMAEDVRHAPGIQTGKDYLLNIQNVLKSSKMSVEVEGEPIKADLGKHAFYHSDFVIHVQTKDVYESFWATIDKRFALAFVFIAGSPEERAQLVKTLDKVHFDK